jgi:hypothetical protein
MSKQCYLISGRNGSLLLIVILFLLLSSLAAYSQPPGDVIMKVESYSGVVLGGYVDVEVTLQNNTATAFGGFELLVEYDTTLLTLTDVAEGQLLTDCVWEYFSFRADTIGLVRVVSIADLSNGDIHPECMLADTQGPVAVLTFRLSGDQSLQCQAFPVQFYWMNCWDNAVADTTGDTLFISSYVYEWLNHTPIHEDDEFPTHKGAPDVCTTAITPRLVDFISGHVETYCWTTYRGDLNLNGVAYEIADYLLYIQYFFYGLGVFDINPEGQIAASDVNADGMVLTFVDLIYLYRVIIGDAPPFPSKGGGMPVDTAVFVQDTIRQAVSVQYPDSLAYAFMGFSGDVTLGLAGGEMSLQQVGGAALVYPCTGWKTYFGDGVLLNYTGSGYLTSVSAWDYAGSVPTDIVITAEPGWCGDADGSGGSDIDDVVYLIAYVFSSGPPPEPLNAGDVDCSGDVDIDDIVYIIMHIFGMGPPPCDPDNDGVPDC